MKPDSLVQGVRQRRFIPGKPTYPGATLLLVLLFSAGGMNGTNCNGTLPGPGGGGSGGGGGGTGGGPAVLSSDHVMGSSSAKVTVVEYEDFQ